MAYKLNTESAQSSGPENIGPGRRLWALPARRPVLSLSCITLENKGKIRPQPDRENSCMRASGGGNATGSEPSPPHNPLKICV